MFFPPGTTLRLVNKHFTKTNKFWKIFNRNNMKVSTENVKSVIQSHNRKVLY